MITFKKVTKSFGKITALDDVSFEIKPGEFAFITGPSGAGKTTIIRLILREVKADAGQVTFADRNIAQLKSAEIPHFRRQIGVIFQDFKLLFDRTLGENVGLVLSVLGLPADRQRVDALELLKKVGLANRFDAFPSQLAGGELQRAVIARALAVKPKLLLADEPTGNLDLDTAWEIIELMNDINKKDGTTILMASHNRDIVDKMKTHVVELKQGKVTRDKANGKYKE